MELTEQQKLMLEGKICPYCKKDSQHVNYTTLYGGFDNGKKFYYCESCKASVGCHSDGVTSLGRLSIKSLRRLKNEAHKYFDMIWLDKTHATSRTEAYQHLSNYLKLPLEYTHIGIFGEKTCKEVMDWSKMILNDLRRLNLDCGIDCKRKHIER